MSQQKHYYLIHIQYLGYRYHGWAKQPGIKTVHHMIDRTLKFVLGDVPFRTLGSSRTDKMVSANASAFELFLDAPLADDFLDEFNLNLPFDIRALSIEEVDEKFNIIQAPKQKRYAYHFCFGAKPHPFNAPLLSWFPGDLDIELMQQGATLFEGGHEFKAYCKKPSKDTVTTRSIERSEIVLSESAHTNYSPEKIYVYQVEGGGFMRNQIRMMMGQLVRLGRKEIDLEFIEASLKPDFDQHLSEVAPASGLTLESISFR